MEEKKKPRQLYFKLFWTYTAIVVCIVLVLVLYFMSASQRRNLEANRQAMEQVNRQAAEYVEETEKIADYVFSDLYRSASELEDLLAYFSMSRRSIKSTVWTAIPLQRVRCIRASIIF